MKAVKVLCACVVEVASAVANADVCDYRPSELVGATTTSAAGIASSVAAAAGAAMKAAGFYTLGCSVSGVRNFFEPWIRYRG